MDAGGIANGLVWSENFSFIQLYAWPSSPFKDADIFFNLTTAYVHIHAT